MNSITEKTMTTQEVADRFNELAQQEKWFEIQDEFFADDVRSIDPDGSPLFQKCIWKECCQAERGKLC